MSRQVLILGAAGALGKKIAEAFSSDELYVSDLHTPDALPEGATFIQCNICEEESVKELRRFFEEKHKKIDVLVYAVGVYEGGKVSEITPQNWKRVMDINVNGLYLVLHELLPFMNEHGKIIAIASQFGLVGVYESAAYCASKAAMINLIRCVALDYGKKKLNVNCICPGFFESPFLQEVERNTVMKREWMSVMGMLPKSKVDVEDIVNVVTMLSENNSITGQCITIDGGYTAR